MTLLARCCIQYSRLRSPRPWKHHVFCRHARFESSVPSHKVDNRKPPPGRSPSDLGEINDQPWVQPHSLKETIEQHRNANRTGEAINGQPIRTVRARTPGAKQGPYDKSPAGHHGPAYRRLDISGTLPGVEHIGGETRPPTAEWRPRKGSPRRLRMPWLRLIDQGLYPGHNTTAHERLAGEISACHQYLSPTTLEQNSAHKALKDTMRTLASIPDCQHMHFTVIGSRATGLCGPLSDLDLNLVDLALVEFNSSHSMQSLRMLYQSLKYYAAKQRSGGGLAAHAFRPGRVPLIDCTHIPSGLNVQVQYQSSRFQSTEMTKAYLAEYPTLCPLFRIVKQMLRMRGLTVGSHGGITSYPLLQMLVASLKLSRSTTSDVASHLLEFLDLYSEIDFGAVGIEYIPIRHETMDMEENSQENPDGSAGYDPFSLQPRLVRLSHPSPPYLMSLQDPANASNDLGKAAVLIKHVQATFIEARAKIRNAMVQWDLGFSRGINMRLHGQPILAWCLEGDYAQFDKARQKLCEYGSPQT